MGIFGAMTTAIAGLQSQSFALEHVSDNIANSQTIGYKRTETVFKDLVTESRPGTQPGGSVFAMSRATNTVAGDIQDSSIATHMSISGDGYFIVEEKAGESDGNPIFLGVDLYTRRGDFELDKNGQLKNTAGYYLKGIPVDAVTGNPVGGTPQVITITNGFLPAQSTTTIDYEANLPIYPNTADADPLVPGSELLDGSAFSNIPVTAVRASVTGSGAAITADAAAARTGTADLSALSATGGNLDINGTSIAIGAGANAAAVEAAIDAVSGTTGVSASINGSNQLVLTSGNADTAIDVQGTSDATTLTELGLTAAITSPNNLLTQGAASAGQTLTIQYGSATAETITFGTGSGQVSTFAELQAAVDSITGVAASIDSSGNISLDAPNNDSGITVGGSATLANFGLSPGTTNPTTGAGTVIASEVTPFIDSTIAGGALTAFSSTGAAVDIQFRWGKISDGQWNLFALTNSSATGSQVAWRNVGIDYTFNSSGQLTPPITTVALNNFVVDGINLGNITLDHGTSQITQFADANGVVSITRLEQDGFGSGQLESIEVSSSGRIVGNYTNGEQLELYEVTLASFNADSMLAKLEGGAFAATSESGAAILGAQGSIVAATLEASNADIADEFSKLIITQQAYAAGTRIVTTADEMMTEALNMVR